MKQRNYIAGGTRIYDNSKQHGMVTPDPADSKLENGFTW